VVPQLGIWAGRKQLTVKFGILRSITQNLGLGQIHLEVAGSFFTVRVIISVSKKTLFHGINYFPKLT
jgi:hypothetical protein